MAALLPLRSSLKPPSPRLSISLRKTIAQSLDTPADAAPYLEEFFRPLTALGSVPRRMVGWLREAGVDSRSTLLDLGCGKGAVSIGAARALGCRVVGIDAFPAFVESCRALAEQRGVTKLCDFRAGLIHAGGREKFDAVVMLNVLPFEKALPIVRRQTKRCGIYIIDDAVRVSDAEEVRNFPSADEVEEAIELLGDRVERSRVWTASEVRRRENANYALLAKQAGKLMRENPECGPILRECLRRQRKGIADLAGEIQPACWLVRKGGRR